MEGGSSLTSTFLVHALHSSLLSSLPSLLSLSTLSLIPLYPLNSSISLLAFFHLQLLPWLSSSLPLFLLWLLPVALAGAVLCFAVLGLCCAVVVLMQALIQHHWVTHLSGT